MKGRKSKSGDRENEIKLAVAGVAAGRRLLRAGGFRVTKPRVFESNLVLDTPEHTILHSGGLLRLRLVGSHGVLTFKGPADADSQHKSREEVESEVDDPKATLSIIEHLGYRQAFRYDKFRTEFERPGEAGTATLDETPAGVYMELEGSPRWVDRTARLLGYSPSDYITMSYGKIWSEHCAARGEPMRDMVFSSHRA